MLILDVQLSEDDETTRAEQLKDERALNDFEQLIDNIAMSDVWKELKNTLQDKELFYNVIYQHYHNNKTFTELAKEYGYSQQYIAQQHKKALRELRKPRTMNKLKSIYDEVIGQSIRKSGAKFFIHTNTSSVEWAVMELERIKLINTLFFLVFIYPSLLYFFKNPFR